MNASNKVTKISEIGEFGLIDKLKNNFELHINEAHYQKENVYFKVPQKLKS